MAWWTGTGWKGDFLESMSPFLLWCLRGRSDKCAPIWARPQTSTHSPQPIPFPSLPSTQKNKQLSFNWTSKIHRYLGKAALVFSGLAISTGLYSRWGKATFEDEKIRAGLALCIIVPQALVALDVTTRFAGDEKKSKKK